MVTPSCVNRLRSGLSNRMARPRRRSVRHSRQCGLEVLESRQLLSTFTVTNLHDFGAGSLRRAIIASNERPGIDTIDLKVSGSIQAGQKALPAIKESVNVIGNQGQAVRIDVSSHHHRFKQDQQSTSVTYYNANNVSIQPVTGWQGIRGAGVEGKYLIAGTSTSNGLLTIGSIKGIGTSYGVVYPNAYNTSVYGPNWMGGGQIQLVGSYKNADYSTAAVAVHGFLFQGSTAELSSAGSYRTIDYPGATYNYVHSTMGGLAVGNYDGPTSSGLPLGPGQCYIYNTATSQFLTNIVFPGSISNTAYGIWYNGGHSYTICGGYSNVSTNNMADQNQPIGQAYLVDYNSATGRFSHWTSFSYPSGVLGTNFITHFEGISSVKRGVYTLSAMSVQTGSSNLTQGSMVTVRRKLNGRFSRGSWVNLNYPGVKGLTTSDSVYGNQVVGIVLGANTSDVSTTEFAYQATVHTKD